MAYITNREDERLLSREEFQEKMAKTINTSIKKSFKP
jgi:N-acetylmuramoyl-L-alanine amidase